MYSGNVKKHTSSKKNVTIFEDDWRTFAANLKDAVKQTGDGLVEYMFYIGQHGLLAHPASAVTRIKSRINEVFSNDILLIQWHEGTVYRNRDGEAVLFDLNTGVRETFQDPRNVSVYTPYLI